MNHPDNKRIQELRSQAQALEATLQVGKNGITDATLEELRGQLKRRKLVKVRLLPASAESGGSADDQARALADGVGAVLVEVRGSTAVLWKA